MHSIRTYGTPLPKSLSLPRSRKRQRTAGSSLSFNRIASGISTNQLLQSNPENSRDINRALKTGIVPSGVAYHDNVSLLNASRDIFCVLLSGRGINIDPYLPVFIDRKNSTNVQPFINVTDQRSAQMMGMGQSLVKAVQADGYDMLTFGAILMEDRDLYNSLSIVKNRFNYIGVISDTTVRYTVLAKGKGKINAFIRVGGTSDIDSNKIMNGKARTGRAKKRSMGFTSGALGFPGKSEKEYVGVMHPFCTSRFNKTAKDNINTVKRYLDAGGSIPEKKGKWERGYGKRVGIENNYTYDSFGIASVTGKSIAKLYGGYVNGFNNTSSNLPAYICYCKAHAQEPIVDAKGKKYFTYYVPLIWVNQLKPEPSLEDCGYGKLDINGRLNSLYNDKSNECGAIQIIGRISYGTNGLNGSKDNTNRAQLIT